MAFTSLQPSDKKAFFALLDEYFSSRPGILQDSEPSTTNSQSAIPNRAMQHNPPSPLPAVKKAAAGNSTEELIASAVSAASTARANQVAKLVPQKKFGDVDVSSGKNMFSSLRHSTASKTAIPPSVAPRIPSAFNARVNQFGPPPTRHVAPAAESPSSDPVSPAREEPRKINRTEDGEWAEAVYDYSSEDAGDLQLREHQRVLVVEKTSEDWWTGESEGQQGLFPASYVRVL